MITETKEFLEIVEILAKSNISLDDCEKITHFMIELNNKNKSYERLIENWFKVEEIDKNENNDEWEV